ncbi:PLxRFG domain-containing protein [Rhodoferax ferrireducens]|uniref:PLxRFG domain-containing protein n=1 Tax=Rhodoferax ferrireducens TaxID=192843 RepID=UPI000E0CCE88|nr:PLxRFG domain-containing protein [Rhodoferax ferrireducens]
MADLKPFTGKLDEPQELKPFTGVLDGQKSGALRTGVADKALGFASGAIGATKAITDAAGAGNAVSNTLADVNTGINDYLSQEAKADQQTQSALMADAQGKGAWEGIKAGAKAFAVAPVQTAVQGLGSIVPIIAGTALTGGAAPAAAVGAGIGVAMGAGTAKGAIFDDIKKRSLASGMNEADATAAATKAQEYTGANTDQIALGGALGAADALTGVSRIAGGMARGALRKPVADALVNTTERGFVGRTAMGMAGEMPLEAAQGGQEQLAANVAAQRAGFEAGTWDNVASNATLEALASAGPGAAFGAMEHAPAKPVVPPAPALQIGNTPDPYVSFADGTVARQSEADAYINGLPPEQQPAARAKIMGLAPQPSIPEAAASADMGIPITETAIAPVKPSEAMGLDPAAGPLSAAAVTAVDTGAHQEIALNEANAADQAAYDEAMTAKAQQDAEQDTSDKPITHGPLAEAAMSAEDKQAIMFGNARVGDGGTKYAGTQDGDILNGLGKPYPTRFAAQRRARMEGKDWTIAPVTNGFVARRADAKAGAMPAADNAPVAGLTGSSTTQAPAEASAEIAQNQPAAIATPAQSAIETVASIDAAAHSAATSPNNDLAQPTEAQKIAGNYPKGHVKLNGLDLAIENPAGSIRSGKDKGGKAWENTIKHHYGYIKGTMGNDKDHVDLFVKPETPLDYSGPVFVIDQIHPDTGKFDEHKVMVGFPSMLAAKAAYQSNYAKGWKGMQAVTPMPFDEFKTWVKAGPKNTPLSQEKKAIATESIAQQATNSIATTKENTNEPQATQAIEATQKKPAPERAAGQQVADHIGRDNQPLSEGGKPFKTRDAATEAKKLQPMLRVVKSGKGFALAPKTDKQLAAEVKAAKRLGNPQTSPKGESIPAHAFIASEGGMHAGTKSDMNIGINPRIGNRTLFAGKDQGLSMERATARLIEEGYLPEGSSHNDAAALIKRSLTKPQYTATGTETAAQADIEARFDDYLAAEQEAAQANDFDPFISASDLGFTIDDAEMAGYDAAEDPIKLEVNALLAQAGALGIDTSDITEQAYEDTRNGSEQDYYDAARAALASAIETSDGNSRQDAGQQGDAGAQAGLTAPTRDEVLAQQERADSATKAEAAQRKAQDLSDKRDRERKDIAKASEAAADTFVLGGDAEQNLSGQGGMFDEPAAPPVSKTETTATPAKTPSADELRAKADLMNALADLGGIFNAPFKSNMMPEQEQKLLPVLTRVLDAAFRLGYVKFKDAAKFALDQIKAALGAETADALTLDHLQGAYIAMAGGKTGADSKRAVIDIEAKSEIEQHTAQTDNERNGESNAASTNSRVERNRQEPAAEPAMGNPVPAEPAGTDPATAEAGGRTTGSSRGGQQDGAGVPFGSAPVAGERGNQRLRAGVAEPELADIVTGADFSEPGGDSGISGVPPESISAGQVAAAADQRTPGLKAGIERARADRAQVMLGDIDSIRATLPQLLPGQQDDVLMTEQRFAEPKGYGMLFTNGTGTGKTFTGLGAIKRHALQGKNNILIAAPDDKIASDWMESGKLLGLNISKLADTKDAGNGIVITTYANLGENDQLATRQWDLVVADEAHSLMQAADGKPTGYLQAVRALTYHPDGTGARHDMLNRDKITRSTELRNQISANNAIINNQDTMDVMVRSLGSENAKLHAEEVKLNAELRESMDAMKSEVAAKQGAARPRLLALSATPFAYEKTIDWANGYLFEYTDGYPYDANEAGLKYNLPDPREYYFQTRFGYTMRYNKLTQPDAKIDSGMLQRQWNGELKKAGALSGRMLDVVPDYDRRFVLVDSAIGNRIDEALAWLTEQRLAAAKGDGGFAMLSDVINDKFKYLEKRYLLEAIKATEVIPIVKQHMAMGRKVVVFHDYKKGGGFNPFRVAPGTPAKADAANVATAKSFSAAVSAFNDKFSDLVNAPLGSMPSPIDVFSREIPEVLLINGDQKKANLLARYKSFQDDGTGPQVMLVQSAKNKGWSGHDTTGKHQRVLINLGQPTAPTLAIQQEGRIYRTGQASDAIMRYLNTGTNWERWTFASTIASRASTAENLGMGEMARALKDSFIQSFEESDAYPPGHDDEGKGGKERDKAANNAVTEYDRAKTHYWATQKKNSRTKAQEGADYFATPEPLGLKMVQWLDARSGEDLLEPSGGHGAIARWLPEKTSKTVIEPSLALRSRLAMVMNVAEDRVIDGTFEEHAIVNKYDGIVMNPPFGTAGRTAVDHIAKAATHLRDGGRIVALLPTGPAADKKFDQWFFETSEKPSKMLATSADHGPIFKGDTVTSSDDRGERTFVVGSYSKTHDALMSDTKGYASTVGRIIKIEPTGKRTESYSPSAGLQLVATIKLPQVTFERAGTAVATRIVVIEKTDANGMQRDRDLSDITDINELFDRLENMDFPARPKVDAVVAEEPAKAEKPAKTPKQTAPKAEVGDNITLGDKSYPVATYTTNAGKVLRGVWAASKTEALQYGPSTFEKKGLGFFVRERDFPKGDAPDAPALSRKRPVFSRGAQAQATQSVSKIVDAIKSGWANAPEIIVAFDMQDDLIPERVRQEDLKQRSGGAAGTPEGFYYAGKVYLMSSQLNTANDVARVLFHETLGHFGLRGHFGGALKPILQQIVTFRRALVDAKIKEYGLRSVSNLDRMTAAEEVLAEMAQNTPNLGFVKRAIAAIRNWLRANVPGFQSMQMTDADIVQQFILPARRFVERGGNTPAPSTPRGRTTTQPVFSRSMTDTLNAAANNVRDVKLPAGYLVGDLINSVPGKLNWWHKTVGTQYNLAQRSAPFKRVFDSVQNFINDVSFFATEAADLAPNILPKLESWKDIGKSPLSPADTKAISAPIFEGTLTWARDADGKPVKARGDDVAGVVWTNAELKSLFNLSDKQIPLYREFRAATDKSLTNLAVADMLRFGGDDVAPIRDVVLASKSVTDAAETLRDYLTSLAEADPARSDALLDTAEKMIAKGDKAADLMARGYAPLSRFGQYTLDVVHNGERVYFGMFENRFDAAKMNRQMQAEYPGATINQGTVSEQAYKMFAGVTPETLELFGDMLGLEATGDGAANEAFQTYLKLAKSSRSAMKRLIQRKGIAGFNEDAGRVLAGFVYSNARQTASSLHMGEMTKAATDKDAFKNQGELQDAAAKLVDYIKNPQEEAQAFRGLLFAQYIGGSIASAMVNMTQPLTMTFPWLAQFSGVTTAAKQMTAAVKDANKPKTGNAQLDTALRRAEEDGTVSPQEVHQLMQQAQGRGALQSGDGTTAGNAMATANNLLSRITLAWGKPFSWAEQFNRRVTFIAAYRTAVAQGMADPDSFARRAISETQGIYNKGNKPDWARGAFGGVLFTFKQYSISYVEMLSRMAKNGPEGKKAALLALGVLFLLSGSGGMPGADDLDDLISGAMQSMGYNFDSKSKRQEFFAGLFGEGGAQFLERGVSGLPGVPIDVSGRMGLGNLIPGTGLFTKKVDHTRDVAEFAGPGGDLIKRGFDAAGKLITGDAGGAVKSIAPKAVQNLAQAFDMANMGMYRDAKGGKVLDTDGYDALAKAIGFQPNDVKRSQDASFEVQRMIGLNRVTESEIANRWALGLFEKDQAKVRAARDDLAEWNRVNPESPIRIKFGQVAQRVKKMNETKSERIAKTAPKEIRNTVRQELEASR